MMMQQIQQLQQTVRELQTGAAGHGQPGYGGNNGGGGFGSGSGLLTPGTQGHSNYQSGGGGGTWSNNGFGGVRREYGGDRRGYGGGNKKPQEPIKEEEQTVLLVSNIPPNLSNPDSLFYAFEKFGSVERVKVLHNKRTTALVQMSQPAEAQRAVEEQDSLNRTGSEIYVNFSSNFSEITVPSPGSNYDNGLAKDFSITAPGAGTMPPPPAPEFGDNFARGFNNDGGARGGGRGMFSDHGNRAGAFDEFTMMGSRGGQGGGVVLLVSNLPDEVANVDCIFNMIGMYGDVMYVKILRNKKDCCMVQLAKPHHAQQVKQFLDGAKIGGNKLCISYSRVETFLNKRIPEDDENQREFLNSRNHRYRNQNIAAKLLKNLGPPTCTLHVANLPEGYSHLDIKVMMMMIHCRNTFHIF